MTGISNEYEDSARNPVKLPINTSGVVKSVLSISEEDVGRTLTFQKYIQLGRRAYALRAMKKVLDPLRTWFTFRGGDSFYFMPDQLYCLDTVCAQVLS